MFFSNFYYIYLLSRPGQCHIPSSKTNGVDLYKSLFHYVVLLVGNRRQWGGLVDL